MCMHTSKWWLDEASETCAIRVDSLQILRPRRRAVRAVTTLVHAPCPHPPCRRLCVCVCVRVPSHGPGQSVFH